ncbi:MAG: DUF3160 domain-containing protein, partial [Bacillota bacterium]|nr:DUF3160 domain-containing protein [Bacillota bacterium]
VPNLSPIQVEESLQDVLYADRYDFSKKERTLLAQNQFFVRPQQLGENATGQLFEVYEENDYNTVPSFITTDSVMHAYHIFYDYSLRTLEQEKLFEIAKTMSNGLFEAALTKYRAIQNPEVKEVALRNVAFFAVACELLGEPRSDLPAEAEDIVRNEVQKVESEAGTAPTEITGYDLDYTQFTVRGHYTRSEELGKYFKAFMWYGQLGMPLYRRDKERDEKAAVQGLLIADLLTQNKDLFEQWQKIYEPTVFYVGKSDDLSSYEFAKLLYAVYGEKPDAEKMMEKDNLDAVYELAKELPQPKIDNSLSDGNMAKGQQFRFMGQRYILDSEIMQNLMEPIVRPIPSGLDIASAFGSKWATELSLQNPENQKSEKYPENLKKETERVAALSDDFWMENMYTGWLWTVKGYFKEFAEGFPSFMTNRAWGIKNVASGLGSWSELKHDTILYGKSAAAEMGGAEDEPVKGYVEPNLEVYERLQWLTKYSISMLQELNILPDHLKDSVTMLTDELDFLINASEKELKGEPLTEEEYASIRYFGGVLESIMLKSAQSSDGYPISYWYELTSNTDRNMGLIADVATVTGNSGELYFLEVGVGPAQEIFVVCDIEGKKTLTRGAVFGYYEFLSTERMTDEGWQNALRKNKAPAQPEWVKEFMP